MTADEPNGGDLGANKLVQLKLTTDVVNITDKYNANGRYEWVDDYNVLSRADLPIEPEHLSG